MNPIDPAGKNVLITGASSGIGEHLAREFHRNGARVFLLARRRDRLNRLGTEFNIQRNNSAMILEADVTDPKSLEEAFRQISAAGRTLDIVVANAGWGHSFKFEDAKIDDYRAVFETNVFGVLNTAKLAFEHLKKSKGVFSVTGSVAGYVAGPTMSAYSMTKFAVRAFCESLRTEWAEHDISVTLISPGFVKSEIHNNTMDGHKDLTIKPRKVPFEMDTDKAAREIYAALIVRRPEVIVTLHGKILVWFSRHLPALLKWIIRKAGIDKR